VLARFPYGERDLVIGLLTRLQGQLRALIRGVRGARVPRTAALESLCQVEVEGFQKAGAELATLTEATMVSSSFPLAQNPSAWAAGQVVAELALLYCPPGQRSEPSFRLVDRCTQGLLQGLDPLAVAHYAELWFLRLTGVLPGLEKCGRCGRGLEDQMAWFDGEEGVLVCDRHRPLRPVTRLDWESLGWLREASRLPVEQLNRSAPKMAGAWLAGLRASFADREVRSWKVLLQMTRVPSGMPTD